MRSPARRRPWRGGFRAGVHRSAGDDALLRHRADGERDLPAALSPTGIRDLARRRAVAQRDERAVPRHPLHCAISDAILAVHHADCVSE